VIGSGDGVAFVAAFAAMEPVTYAAHRWVMHGLGWVWHRSHHRAAAGRWEANDGFPVIFAALTITAMAVATHVRSLHLLLAVGVGVTAYGAAYGFVHDVYIHARFGRLPVFAPFEHLKEAHALHHLFGEEPYGMLCPVVPRQLRGRTAARGGISRAPRQARSGRPVEGGVVRRPKLWR
jgi:beta-carotene 3-hydroxylase